MTTERESLVFVKRLVAVGVSNILYLRDIFSEDCFGHRKLDALKLRILTERGSSPAAKQMVTWMKGCFHAIDQKFLKQLSLNVFTDPSVPHDVTESYSFTFTYSENNENLKVCMNDNTIIDGVNDSKLTDAQELKRQTLRLLRSLILVTQSLEKLPTDSYLTMRLTYYEEVTPAHYEPPGFMPLEEEEPIIFRGRPITINAGEVKTSFHGLKVKICADEQQFDDLMPTQGSAHVNSSKQ